MKKLLLIMLVLFITGLAFADTVQVGTGTATSSYLPIYGLYGYNYTQQIYTQAQIGVAGNITKIRFYYVSGTITNSKDWVVYMGHTTKTTFATTTDWEPLANLTQVFAGDVTSLVPLANNWMEITLTTPFAYNNTSNLIVAVDENTAGYASMSWGAFTSGANTGIYYSSDTVNPDPAAPPAATSRTATIDRIQFFFPNSAAPLAPTLVAPFNGGWALTGDKLYWTPTAGGSDANTYDVYFGTAANPPLVSDNQAATNYTPTLAPGTTYYWKVVASNEIGDSPASAIWSFMTPSATQLAESFENTSFPPAGWANGTSGTWSRNTTTPLYHGVAKAYKYTSTSTAYQLSTPRLTIVDGSTLNFWTYASATSQVLQVVYSNDRVTWTQVGSNITYAAANAWYNQNVDLSSLAGSNYYLAFQTPIQTATGSVYVDYVFGPEITPEAPGAPALSTPADLATNVNEFTNFTWTAPTTGGVPTGYKLYVDTVNPPVAQVADLNALTYTLTTPLAYNTTYYWSVAAYNGAGTGVPAVVRSFTTRANPTITTLPFTEGFETGNTDAQPVALWSSVYVTGTKNWTANSTATSYNRTPRTGSFNAFLGWSASTWMIRPVQLTGGTSYDVEVFARQDNADTALANMTIAYGTSGTAAGMTNIIVPQTGLTNGDYQRLIGSFTPPSTGVYYIGILGTLPTTTNWYVSIDDITIRETPATPIFSVTPAAWDFGQTVINTVNTKQFTVANSGGGSLTISNIGISGSYYTLTSNPAPVTLGASQSATFTVQYAPTVAGTHEGTVTITDNRAVTTVDLDGVCVDPSIYYANLPYTQNFDGVTAPALPFGWAKVGTTGSVYTQTTSPNSAPNCVYIYTPATTLALPPVNMATETALRMKFWARGNYTAGDALIVGYLTNPTDASTFTPIQSVTMAGLTYAQYQVTLGSVTGIKYYAIQAGTLYYSMLIDDVVIEEVPPVPVFSYTPSSIAFGDAVLDRPTPWSNVTVSNTGGSTLNLAAGDISIIGTDAALFEFDASNLPAALTVGQSVTIPVRMTADSEGAKSATLRMTYNSVDYDVALSGNGLPEGIIPIGNGNVLLNIPIYSYYGYSYSQSLFLQSEIDMAGQRIEKVKYYWNGVGEGIVSNDWVIYMGHTTKTAFDTTTDWIPAGNMTQVFSGTVALPATAGWIEITLDTPFVYNNSDNLVIAVDENEAGYEDESGWAFLCTNTATSRSLRYQSDGTNPDPAAPPTASSLISGIPNVQLLFGDIPLGPPLPVVMGSPADEAVGQLAAGFNFTWAPDPLSGPIDYYAFFLSTDDQDLYGQFYGETTGNSFNPVGQPYGDGTFAFDYSTRYYWQVIAYQGTEEAASDVRWFEIEADPNAPIVSYPYVVDFEAHAGNTLPSGWSRTSNATGWQVGTSLGSSYWSIPAHTVYAAANDDAAGSAGDGSMDLLISPYLDFTGDYEGIPLLTFDSYYTGSYGQLANVEISTDGVNWTSIYTVAAGTTWEALTVSLADYDGMDGLKIRFHADDAGDWASGWAVDNIGIDFVNIDLMAPIVNHYPVIGWPDVANDIPVYAEVTDDLTWNSGITSVTLDYSVDAGVPVSVPMTLVEGLYEAVIPAQAAGSIVSYTITAIDASAQLNSISTDAYDFEVNSPVWMTYDSNTITNNIGLASGTFGVMTGFENPFGAGNPVQINSIFGRWYNAISANVHVCVYDGVNDVFVDIIPSFSQAFLAGTDTTIPLTGCTTTAGYIYVAFTDVVGPAYHALDGTQDYYPGTHFVHFGAGLTTAGLGTVEGSGFPGSWLIRANMEAGTSALDAPVVSVELNAFGEPVVSWEAVAGANSYQIYGAVDPYAADPWTLLDTTTMLSYTYGGTGAMQFFKVVADSESPIVRGTATSLPTRSFGNAVKAPKVIINNIRN